MQNVKDNESCYMKLGALRFVISKLVSKIGEDSEVWLSSDEEGNEFLPMSSNPNLSVAYDKCAKKVIFFPNNKHFFIQN